MKHSIVIPYHKDKNMILYSLKTLYETLPPEFDFEVIIVGNNRNPHELDLDISYPNCRLYKIFDNLFYPKAVNYGVEKTTGGILTICDPDIFYLPGWYSPLLRKLLMDKVGAVGSKLINPCNGRIIDFGVYYSKYNAIHSLKDRKADCSLAKQDQNVQSICSAILMTYKNIFEQVGGMDVDLPFAYTDFDFCLKVKNLGYSVWAVAESEVYHKGSSDKNNSKYYAFNYLRTDCKGLFYAKDFQYIKMDAEKWFCSSYIHFRKLHSDFPTKYFLLDMTTVYNREDYYDILERSLGFTILDREVIDVKSRNLQVLPLHQLVSFNLIDCNSPILYFVDTFISMFSNDLWFRMRDISRDLVIDRNGNILPCTDVAQGKC